MRILGQAKVNGFAKKHVAARKPLTVWTTLTEGASWKNFVELKATFSSADYVAGFVVFNIGGNKYRLIAAVDYAAQRVIVAVILTHAEYSKGAWKQ